MSGKNGLFKGLGLLFVGSLAALFTFAAPAQAATGINQQLSFQGKVVRSDGTNIPDGTYDMEFKIYQDGNSSGSGSSLMWTEDYLVSGSTGMPSTGGVTVTAGTFQVNLGSVCVLAGSSCGAKTNTGVDFNQDTLWLSFEVGNTSSCTVTSSTTSFHSACGGDGAMTPFIRLTAVPQAMNANKVGGLTASQLVQLTPSSQQSGSINVSGGITSGGTVSATGATLSNLTNCDRLNSNSSGTVGCSTSADLRINKLSVYGDSYAAGGTVALPNNFNTNRFTSKVAALTHAQEYNKAVNGQAALGGGWIGVLQGETRSRTSAPYVAAPGAYLINYGLNDIKYVGPSSYGPMQEALRTIISRARAAAVFEDSDASVAYGGTWTNVNATDKNSGTSYRSTTTNGNTVTISVPSDFPGGTIDVGLIGTSNGDGAIHTIKEGATTLTTVDTHNAQTTTGGNNGYLGMVRRITLSAGAHTIVDTVTSITGTTYFDYWQVEAPTPPLVIVPLAPRLMSYSTFAPYTPVDADIATLNAAKTSVFNEFDSSVVPVDFDSVLNKTAAYYTSDNVHPNDQGNSLLAAAVYKAITNASYTVDQQAYGAVLQSSYYSNNILFQNNDDSTTGFQIQSSAGVQVLTADTTNQRIGIGTSTPQTKLEVVETGSGTRGIMTSQYSSDTGGAFFIGRKARGTLAAPTAVQNGDSLFVLFSQAYDGGAYLNPASISFKADGAISSGTVPTSILLSTGSSGTGTGRLLVGSSGNVGIGSLNTTPAYQLEVVNSSGSGSQLHVSTGTTDTGSYLLGIPTGTFLSTNAAYNGTNWVAKAATASVISQTAAGGFSFSSNTGLTAGNTYTPTTVLSLSATGSLTLGTIAASGAVNQGKLILGDGTTDNRTITLQSATITGGSSVLAIPDAAGVNDTFCLQTKANCTTTLQTAYDNSSSPATITTSSSSKGVIIAAGSSNDSTSLFQVQSATNGAVLTVDSSSLKLQVGSGTTDGTVVLLQLDSVNTYGAAPSCSATTNQGAMFYNTASNTVRACLHNNWEDLVSTSGLGIMGFGVIADTGISQGDVAGVSGLSNSPCKVTWTSTTSITVNPCAYFSGGRKNSLDSALTITGLSTASTWYHICADGTNNTFQADSGTETTGFPSFSTNNPVLCVADVLTGSGGTITNIYDVRTFTDVLKRFFTASTATGLGQVVVQDTTGPGLVKTVATTGSAGIDGVVVATSGASSSNSINVIVATRGALLIKTSGTGASLGKYAETLNTTGYVTGTTATLGKVLGPIYDAADTACNASTNCQYSVYVDGRW